MSQTMTSATAAPFVAQQGPVGEGRRTRYLIAAICIALITIMLWPLVMSALASIKEPAEAASPPPDYWPKSFSIDNYKHVFTYQAGLWTYLSNSLIVAGLTIVFCLVLAVPAGYALARYEIPGKEFWFILILSSMMIPYQSLLVPLYLMFSKLGLSGSLIGLALLHTVLQLPFSVYLMRNSFEVIPKEIEEAATMDGSSSLYTLRRIYLPLVLPGMVTVALFAFIASWNEFIGALILMNKENLFTIPIMLTGVTSGIFGSTNWGGLQAGVMVSIVPCVLVYLLLQRYYISGLLSGAVK